MLISHLNPGIDLDNTRQRLRNADEPGIHPQPVPKPEQKYEIQPQPVPKAEQKYEIQPQPVPKAEQKHEIQPQPITQPRPTPISEADRVTLSLPVQAREEIHLTYQPDGTLPESTPKQQHHLADIMQAMTDAKIGFDREKYDKLQDKIDAILAQPELSDAVLAQLDALEQQQQQLSTIAAERMAEHTTPTGKV